MVGEVTGRADVFRRAAASYGQVGPDLFGYFGARIVELLEVAAGWSVLDVACGTGAVIRAAEEVVGREGRAVGVDLTIEMVEQLRLTRVQRCSA
jgi:ubiquinone/menaquinone biosynthesis C-methylase UbiE